MKLAAAAKHIGSRLAFGSVLVLLAVPAKAAEQRYQLLLDTDNNPATGCVVSAAGTSAPGVDTVLTAVVNTTTTSVTVVRLERQTCAGGVLGAPVTYNNGGWNVGLGNGTGGASVVESEVALASLPVGTFKAWGLGIDSNGATDWTAPFFITVASGPAVAATPVPLSQWALIPLALALFVSAVWLRRKYPQSTPLLALVVIVAATGLVWAGTVALDGNVGDWAGITAAVTDPKGDAPPNADIVAVFDQQDAQNLYLRFDVWVQKDASGNQAPVVNAGPDQSIVLPALANLAGTASDDGLPNPPGALTTTWSVTSGPGTVVFGNVHALATTASFSATGVYVLQLTASDGALSTSDTMQVTVINSPVNQPPVVNAGPNQTITLPAVANLAGTASDDGLPNPPGALTTTWSVVSGPGTVVFGNVHALATTAAFSVAGPYVLQLAASDGALSTSATMQVTVNSAGGGVGPQIAAIADRTIVLGTRYQQLLQATAGNVNDTLTFTLPTAPAGASLEPATSGRLDAHSKRDWYVQVHRDRDGQSRPVGVGEF